MSFEYPHRFLLLLVPAALVLIYIWYWVWKSRTLRRIGDPELVLEMLASRSGRRDVTSFVLSVVGLALLVVALTGPQWGEKQQQVERSGIDIVFAVDLSRSMLAEDVPPSRLDAARVEIERILRILGGDRVAIVGFAGLAFTQCPLTSDYQAVRTFLGALDPEHMSDYQGTAIGRAIGEGVRLLTGRRGADERDPSADSGHSNRGHDQIIVIISDGEDHDTAPELAAVRAREQGIRVFTVAIGTDSGGRIPLRNRRSGRVRHMTDERGNLVITTVQTEALEAIAAAGGGASLTYAGEGTIAAELSREVDRLEAAELEAILEPEREDRFYLFATPALLMMLVAMVFSDRKKNAGHVGVSR